MKAFMAVLLLSSFAIAQSVDDLVEVDIDLLGTRAFLLDVDRDVVVADVAGRVGDKHASIYFPLPPVCTDHPCSAHTML